MSMNIQLYPCQGLPENCNGRYYSDTKFELDSWCTWVLKPIIEESVSPRLPVEVMWVNKVERREVQDIDPGHTWITTAGVLKKCKFHSDDWHPTRVARSKAISAYIAELPDDWPFVVYYV